MQLQSDKNVIIFTHNINLVNKKASTMDETDLGGAMSPSTERKGIAQRLTTDDFDSLDKRRSVLFLDEYNRARPEVRTPLMELVNNHIIPDNREASGFRFLPNFLFTPKFPFASITVPILIEINFPVKVISSEKPLTLTFITANPLSSS